MVKDLQIMKNSKIKLAIKDEIGSVGKK